ncbi:MAG: peptidoglycan D,D-transpeptidase FtsI family protein [Dictyoglomus turgidum]
MSILRARIFFTFWILILFFVEGFIIYSQVSKPENIVFIPPNSERGLIFDRNGYELTFNIKRKSLAVNPSILNNAERNRIATLLSKELNLDKKDVLSKLNLKVSFIWIKRILSEKEYDRIKKYVDGRKIFVVEENYRSYPLKIGTSNLLGFVGVDSQGLYGLEAFLDNYLNKGKNIYLTIDKNLQEIVSLYLRDYVKEYEAKGGFVGIMDLNTGEILVLASLPDIDTNGSLTEIINSSQNIKCPIYSLYEPGSLFKIITAGIALEEKLVDPLETVYCKGEEISDGYKVKCTEPHGIVNLEEAVVKSCNIYFYHLAKKIPYSIWNKYFDLLGINNPVPIDAKFVDRDATVADIEKSLVNRGTIGFGHGIAMNPLKMLWILSVFGNDGILLKLRLIKGIGKPSEESHREIFRQVFSKETSEEVLKMMREVVKKGTANNLSSLKYYIAGKTGTAQVSTSQGYIDIYNHFFIGYIFLGDKKYSILIMLEEPKKGRFAAETVVPLFREIIKRLAIYGRMIN